MNTISIIIPNYNGQKLLERNLPSVLKLQQQSNNIIEVIVVDDKSTDNSVSYLKKNYDKIKIITKKSQTGFPETVNTGVINSKGNFCLLLNTDVSPNLDIVDHLLPYFKNKKTFAVGCLDLSIENGITVKRGRGIGKFHNGFLIHKKGMASVNNKTLWVAGGSGMFNKSVWQKLGGMDTIYSPFYWEDIDLSYRALKSGYEIYFEKKAQVTHNHDTGSILSSYSKKYIYKISLRNQIIFVWKNITDKKYLIEHFYHLLSEIIKQSLKCDFRLIQAFFSAVLLLPKILTKRKIQKQFYLMSDQQVLTNFENETL